MRRVQKRDAVRREKFYCCKNPFPERQPTGGPSTHYSECELMDANTIFNGKVSWHDCKMILLKVTLQTPYLACNYVPTEALPSIHWRYFIACLHVLLYVLPPRLPFYDGSLGKGLVHTIISVRQSCLSLSCATDGAFS